MIRLIERYKRKKVKAMELALEIHSQRINELTKWLETSESDMTGKPCAINGMNKCCNRCVHFKKGKIICVPSIKFDAYYTIEPCSCRLWKSEELA